MTAYRNRRSRFDADEMFFRDAVVPDLDPADAKRLLSAAELREVDPETEITRERETVRELTFLLSGEVDIRVDQTTVARARRGSLIGELGIATGENASATVVTSSATRLFAFEADALRRQMEKEAAIGQALERAFGVALRRKLIRANERVATTV